LRAAVRQAVAAQVDEGSWARGGHVPCEDAGRDCRVLVVGWRELGATKEWKLRGALHLKEVAVEVDRHALAAWLRGGHVVGRGG
jgi:hypothetical protein